MFSRTMQNLQKKRLEPTKTYSS